MLCQGLVDEHGVTAEQAMQGPAVAKLAHAGETAAQVQLMPLQ